MLSPCCQRSLQPVQISPERLPCSSPILERLPCTCREATQLTASQSYATAERWQHKFFAVKA